MTLRLCIFKTSWIPSAGSLHLPAYLRRWSLKPFLLAYLIWQNGQGCPFHGMAFFLSLVQNHLFGVSTSESCREGSTYLENNKTPEERNTRSLCVRVDRSLRQEIRYSLNKNMRCGGMNCWHSWGSVKTKTSPLWGFLLVTSQIRRFSFLHMKLALSSQFPEVTSMHQDRSLKNVKLTTNAVKKTMSTKTRHWEMVQLISDHY